MVSLIDLLPTFIEAGGGEKIGGLDGKSFLGVITGTSDSHRDEVYAAHTGDKEMNKAPMRAIRTSRFKYIVNLRHDIRYTTHISAGGENDGRNYWASWLKLAETDAEAAKMIERYHVKPVEELYDLEKDPYELKNVAAEAGYAKVLAELREKVERWRIEQGEDLRRPLMPEDGRSGDIKYAG
jgi:arylsulfatase A-like enzyme